MTTGLFLLLIALSAIAAACTTKETTPFPAVSAATSIPPEVAAATTAGPPPTTTAVPTTTLPAGRRRTTAPPTTPTPVAATTERVDLVVGGRARQYTLHVPGGIDGQPVALVIDFHGLTSTPDRQDRMDGMRLKANAAGFAVAQPDAELLANAWDTLAGSADVAFVLELIADVSSRVPIDPDRVFAVGFSAGGGMANRLACDASGIFSAIATVGGAFFGWARCEPERPMPVISLHGDADKVVPFEGFGLLPDIQTWASGWAEINGCAIGEQPAAVAADVTIHVWTGCDSDAQVILYEITDGGHGWPGTADSTRIGDTTTAISATDLIWEFFDSQPRD